MLINLSNHPSAGWPANQRQQAQQQYGDIRDLPFPVVPPGAGPEQIAALADEMCATVTGLLPSGGGPHAVHIMGELTLVYATVRRLRDQGIVCVASTTHRQVTEKDGVKTSVFRFVRFRPYQ